MLGFPLASIQVSLLVGPMIPLPIPFLAQALQSVEVNASDSAPSGFQLTFHAERSTLLGLVDDPLLLGGPFSILAPNNRVILTVLVNAFPQVLIDGFITGQVYNPGAPGGSTLTVYGEDVSVKMDLDELSLDWTLLPDMAIVEMILLKYAYLAVPLVVPTPASLVVGQDLTKTQAATDRAYVQQLGMQDACTFCIIPGPLPGVNVAYWGPPLRVGIPQAALSVDMGPFTNVESVSFHYDVMKPQITYGVATEPPLPIPIPVIAPLSIRLPPLALYQPLWDVPDVRKSLFMHPGLDAIEAYAMAQAQTDMANDQVVTVRGTLDTVRYGSVLRAPGLIGVRGAGLTYDGLYYVKQVTHRMTSRTTDWEYKQEFVLTREGIITNVPGVLP